MGATKGDACGNNLQSIPDLKDDIGKITTDVLAGIF